MKKKKKKKCCIQMKTNTKEYNIATNNDKFELITNIHYSLYFL